MVEQILEHPIKNNNIASRANIDLTRENHCFEEFGMFLHHAWSREEGKCFCRQIPCVKLLAVQDGTLRVHTYVNMEIKSTDHDPKSVL